MRSTRITEQALSLASKRPLTQHYVCRSCRMRQIHTSSALLAAEQQKPWTRRLRDTLFGSKESLEAAAQRNEKQKKRLAGLAESDFGADLKITTDRQGREYQVAALVDPSVNRNYVQAATWNGLERMGSEEWVRMRADKGEQYVGFAPKKRLELGNEQWQLLLYHIAVEVLALQRAGRDVGQVCLPRSGNADNFLRTRNAQVSVSEGGLSVAFDPPQAEQQILDAIPERDDGEAVDGTLLLQEAQGAVVDGPPVQPSWKDVPLTDTTIKLVILKRAIQLTGKRLPDPIISSASTLADLYHGFKAKEKPKKLTETRQLQKLQADVPNVKVYPSRRTPIHKEKEIGRWKVIEEELVRRDLPVTGSRYVGAKSYVIGANRGLWR